MKSEIALKTFAKTLLVDLTSCGGGGSSSSLVAEVNPQDVSAEPITWYSNSRTLLLLEVER
tara:strand:- start:8564 stop:8746 length:183 start_codon:yes stop_codon:yes gene_type:complete